MHHRCIVYYCNSKLTNINRLAVTQREFTDMSNQSQRAAYELCLANENGAP